MTSGSRLCTICENAPQIHGATRCGKCQGIFNAIRTKNPAALTKEKRLAPTVNQLRAALGMPAKVAAPTLKSAGHTAKRQSSAVVSDPDYQAALGYIKDVRAQEEGKQGYVYLIAESDRVTGAVDLIYGYAKIGFSTNPPARVPELQTGNPRPLRLMGYKKGTVEDEAALHKKYIANNILQEWFRLTPIMLAEFLSDEKGKV